MSRFVKSTLVMAVVCGGLWAALTTRPVAAADDQKDDEKAVLQADHSLVLAVANRDKKAVDGLLDADFT